MPTDIPTITEHIHATTGFQGTPESDLALESAVWPPEYFDALLKPLIVWAENHEIQFHHVGFTYPTMDAFSQATSDPDLIANDLTTPTAVHHRRYKRISAEGKPDIFIEYHIVGDGNGVQGVHFDFVADDPTAMLASISECLKPDALGAKVVTQSFGGGNAPVAKVGLQPLDNPKIEVGIMGRTHFSDPANW